MIRSHILKNRSNGIAVRKTAEDSCGVGNKIKKCHGGRVGKIEIVPVFEENVGEAT
jgi:hypothetical protein